MKIIRFFAILAMALSSLSLSAQSEIVDKLDKQAYCPLTPGLSVKYVSYDGDGEVMGYYITKVRSVKGSFEKGTIVFDQYFFDEKAKKFFNGESVPMTVYSGQREVGNYAEMSDVSKVLKIQELITRGDASSIPGNIKVGDTIANGVLDLKVSAVEVNIRMTDRKVTDQGEIKTKAGSFDCYQIKEKEYTKTIFKKEEVIHSWYAKGIGCVSQLVYDTKGRLVQKIEVVEISLD